MAMGCRPTHPPDLPHVVNFEQGRGIVTLPSINLKGVLSSDVPRSATDPGGDEPTGTRYGPLLGKSPAMQELFSLLSWVSPSDINLMISGPTGTGKELVAHAVHHTSRRRHGPMAILDCGALDQTQLGSEIFGHEAGTFDGSTLRRPGVFEMGAGGTVFLDEIGELPQVLQRSLLRLLEAGHYRRIGGTEPLPVDARILSATHHDLEEMVRKGTFDGELYLRLAPVKVRLPSLEERAEDIPLLAKAFLNETAATGLAPDALSVLANLRYPGNVRQLRNLVTRAAVFARGDEIDASHFGLLGDELVHLIKTSPCGNNAREREELVAALQAHDYNLTRTARALGVVVNTLKNRMKRYRIPRSTARIPG
jgi:DNA-binding NtrC family response regulator